MDFADGPSNEKATPATSPAVKEERVANPYETEDTIRYTLSIDAQFQHLRTTLFKHFRDKGFTVEDMTLAKSLARDNRPPGDYLEFNTRPQKGIKDRDYYLIQSVHIGDASPQPHPVTETIAKVYPAARHAEIVLDKKSSSFKDVQQIVLETLREVPDQTKHNNMHVFRLEGKAQLAALLTGIADHFEAKDMLLYRDGATITDNEKLIVEQSRESAAPASNVQWRFSTGDFPHEAMLCATATVRGKYISVALNAGHEDFVALRDITLQAKKATIAEPDKAIEQRFSAAIQHLPSDEPEHTYHGKEFAALRLRKSMENRSRNPDDPLSTGTIADIDNQQYKNWRERTWKRPKPEKNIPNELPPISDRVPSERVAIISKEGDFLERYIADLESKLTKKEPGK